MSYTNAEKLIWTKSYREDGKVDMCTAIKEMIEEGKSEGRAEEKTKIIINMIKHGMPEEDIRAITGCEQKMIDMIRKRL